MVLYHESNQIVANPEIREAKFNKDFYFANQFSYHGRS